MYNLYFINWFRRSWIRLVSNSKMVSEHLRYVRPPLSDHSYLTRVTFWISVSTLYFPTIFISNSHDLQSLFIFSPTYFKVLFKNMWKLREIIERPPFLVAWKCTNSTKKEFKWTLFLTHKESQITNFSDSLAFYVCPCSLHPFSYLPLSNLSHTF